ncbi:hypothetical protein BSKO_00846 [Bryopsis sp. KO-2023]|nr:hypothetical protein BSKO_00846 [Bryopsis sp. KO-2023]
MGWGSTTQMHTGPGCGVLRSRPRPCLRLNEQLRRRQCAAPCPIPGSPTCRFLRLILRSSGPTTDPPTLEQVDPINPENPMFEQNPHAELGCHSVNYLQARRLQAACSLLEAMQILKNGVCDAHAAGVPQKAGVLRLEVYLPRITSPLWWLHSQSHLTSTTPSIYFSPRRSSAPSTPGAVEAQSSLEGWGAIAGLGAAWSWHGKEGDAFNDDVFAGMSRFLSRDLPQMRLLGGTRFDCTREIAEEWAPFGSYLFLLPALELAETPDGMCMSCTLAWDGSKSPQNSPMGTGPESIQESAQLALELIGKVSAPCPVTIRAPDVETTKTESSPDWEGWQKLMATTFDALADISTGLTPISDFSKIAARQEFMENGQEGLDDLLSTLSISMMEGSISPELKQKLTKVVLARKSDHHLSGALSALELLLALQERDPSAYQLCLSVPGGGWFIASTPERLYARSTNKIATEAVAGTRPRGPKGDTERDFWLGLDLLQSPKDHIEFTLVRDWLRDALDNVCSKVELEVPKTVLKQRAVQHLYGRLSGELAFDKNDADLLRVLHPTPAVCGRPKDLAYKFLRENESFDRGFYAGPFGWVSGKGAEFVVAIRSALIRPSEQLSQSEHGPQKHGVSLYGGVGVVHGSDPEAEWKELDLKVHQIDMFLKEQSDPLNQPNINMAWAGTLVEELCRLGINTFGVAPGSRSSPLTAAVACHPRTRIVPCLDERSLGFWALGHARSTGMPAPVITSSGTAVANLLPSVVEASLAQVPMLVLSADRPPELRDCGANQTIDQVKIFGGYVRWFQDLPAPSSSVPFRMLLTTVDTAVRTATGNPRGPVHLNFQFREPLAPVPAPGSTMDGEILSSWFSTRMPYAADLSEASCLTSLDGLSQIIALAGEETRPLVVIGELPSQEDSHAAKKICQSLGWPVIADVLSGLRIGGDGGTEFRKQMVFNADHVLLDKEEAWRALRPDVVLQLGGHLTSKRVAQFLEWSSTSERDVPMKWIYVGPNARRDDPAHLITHKLQASFTDLQPLHDHPTNFKTKTTARYMDTWRMIDDAVGSSIDSELERFSLNETVVEPLVARVVSGILPPGHGLFLGNSMPIRDMDMYASGSGRTGPVLVAANRGASGIDGVLSTATGYAVGLNRPVTLVVGDISFIHDTNGLTLLRTGENFPSVTVVLINNAGGGIFSFLPIADSVPEETFNSLWATPQFVDVEGICRSHGILHQQVLQPNQLENALQMAWGSNKHSIVEVVTDRTKNVDVHREIQRAAQDASKKVLSVLSDFGDHGCSIGDVTWRSYSLPLRKPLTTGGTGNSREGFLISLKLKSNSGQFFDGIGEVSPLQGLHKESLEQANREVALMARLLDGSRVPFSLATLQGDFSDWFEKELGIPAQELSPPVRFGIEMALLTAISSACGTSPLVPIGAPGGNSRTPDVEICALVDPQGSLENAVKESKCCVAEGFTTIKVKVARDLSPSEDAQILVAIREAVGEGVNLRCDANQGWSIEEAIQFSSALNGTKVEFIEEPVQNYRDIPEFFRQTGILCALDETVDNIARQSCGFEALLTRIDGVVAWVVKPSLIGSLDTVAKLARAANQVGCKIVISSAFETSIGLACLSTLGYWVDHMSGESIAHGLGTARWFADDVVDSDVGRSLFHGPVVNLGNLHTFLTSVKEPLSLKSSTVSMGSLKWTDQQHSSGPFHLNVMKPANGRDEKPVILFLHGFMGSSMDWLPVMDFLNKDFECLALDIPGHGTSPTPQSQNFTITEVSEAALDVIERMGVKSCVLVGYSLGARIALQMTVMASRRKSLEISQAVIVSGSAGISDQEERDARSVQDDRLAQSLREKGLDSFLESWYKGPIWNALRRRSGVFEKMLERRGQSGSGNCEGLQLSPRREGELSKALSALSTGRMPPLHDELLASSTRFLFVSGVEDAKFSSIGKQLTKTEEPGNSLNGCTPRQSHSIDVPGCGHAVHLENPLYLARKILSFVSSGPV